MADINHLDQRLRVSLLGLRITVFIVMLMWTLDKFVNPSHAVAVFDSFYGINGLGHEILMLLAGIELIIITGFVLGALKRFTYGAVLVFHTVSTLSSFGMYLSPWDNLLFFAAWPMLGACLALYLLRDADNLYTIH